MVAHARFSPEDQAEYTAQLQLVRPNGDIKTILESMTTALAELPVKYPGAPRGFTLLAQIGVVPSQMGIHYFVLALNGNEVAKVAFTLVRTQGVTEPAGLLEGGG